jgi:hypothetical protein
VFPAKASPDKSRKNRFVFAKDSPYEFPVDLFDSNLQLNSIRTGILIGFVSKAMLLAKMFIIARSLKLWKF